MKCQADELGNTPEGHRVIAATDSLGPQVIVKGTDIHLLSQPLENHEAAVRLGRDTVQFGHQIYHQWIDIRSTPLIDQILMIAMATIR